MADQQPKARNAAQQAQDKAKGKPISSHPLFPAIVGLWFGALFGLGSLAVRPSLIESLVMASRIDTILPAAAPPLGLTARILLALVLAASGSLLGAWLGRRIARPKPEIRERKRSAVAQPQDSDVSFRSRDAHPDAPARRPISAMEEIGFGSAGADRDELQRPPLAGRRRTLAIEHDEAFQVHDLAPLPGGAPQILDVAQVTAAAAAAPVEAPLDLSSFAEPISEAAIEPAAEFTPLPEFGAAPPAPPIDWASVQPAAAAPAEPRQMFSPVAEAATPVSSPFAPPIEDAVIEPFVPAAEAAADFSPPASYQPPFSVAPEAPPQLPVQSAPTAPLGDLNMVALADRLASTMRRRRERQDSAVHHSPEMAPTAPAAPEASEPVIEPAQQAEVVPAFAATPAAAPLFGRPPVEPASYVPPPPMQALPHEAAPFAPPAEEPIPIAMPASMRPLSFDDPAEDDDDLASFLPPRHIAMPVRDTQAATPPPIPAMVEPVSEVQLEPAEDETVEDEPVAEESYSSLLDIGLPAPVRQSFVRIEEPEAHDAAIEPVVIFPGQAARNGTAANAAETPAPAFAPTFVTAAEPANSAEDAQSFRRFDAPTAANLGQPIANASVVAQQDPAETERALRAALASLQRMSGAA